MVRFDIGNTSVGNITSENATIQPIQTEGVSSQKETTHYNTKWSKYYGAYNTNPHLYNAIILNATWTWGKGWKTQDTKTEVLLDHFSGWGKDSAQDIFMNMEKTCLIGGDSYAEIIWNDPDKRVYPVNLKPLDPQSIVHVVDSKGILIRYEQHTKLGEKSNIIKFDPRDILHFSNGRIGDEIFSRSLLEVLNQNLIAQKENDDDIQKVIHRQAKPLIMFKLKTDNTTKIAQFKSKMEEAMKKSTDNIIYIPDDENVVSYEVVQITPSPMLLEWKNMLRKDFYSTIGSPELLSDTTGATESGGKIGYFLYSQIVERRQREREAQIWNQLHLKINLIPPESIAPELQQDESKDQAQGIGFQPNDTIAGVGQ